MQTTWVIAADASRARIFEVLGQHQAVREIETFVHRESREMDRELRSDAPGRFGSGPQMTGHAQTARFDPSDYEAVVFSREIGDYVEAARTQNRFDRLCLIAPPKFLGLLRQNLGKDAQRLVERELPKDISWFDSIDAERYVREALASQP